jgi:uncharacterized cupredoxin-like copper-binding protein
MTKYVRILLLAVAVSAIVAVPVAGAKSTRAAAAIAVTAGKPSEFGFKLSVKTVKHGPVTFTVTNGGAVPHDFKVCSKPTTTKADTCAGKVTPMITPGQKATLSVTFKAAGTYEYLCTVPGHATAGMKGLLKVT